MNEVAVLNSSSIKKKTTASINVEAIVPSTNRPEAIDSVLITNSPKEITNTPPFGGKNLKIDEKVYAVFGAYADQIQQMEYGTKLKGSFHLIDDCFLPTVVTNPSILGCVEITCLQESGAAKN